ncbi:MAG: bifunctional UDP-N-acetylglucosamine diphosphorylase/glucosamine-1-phosphate N-acetyltransferase GlmU [Actinobacteria bacterium]|nr:bifunctional UDP-N-acetylglucosamine diphosphorylase/glucosamine-1-phosphate N-acetyltransferase GlmU [Actinomycetota bacterium]
MSRGTTAAVVLAAGLGTRFRSDLAKVMHEVAGRTMLRHILEVLRPLELGQVVVVVGHQADQVTEEAEAADVPGLTTALQEDQLGTGHAAAQALPTLDDDIDRVLVLPGDAPLLTPETLARLLDQDAPAVLLTTELDDPTGYGRILRDDTGNVVGIVEEADATEAQKGLREVNAGMYVFDVAPLADALQDLDSDNAQGEQYLTDVVEILVGDDVPVRAVLAPQDEVQGVNDRVQLATAGVELRRRTLERLMREGATIIDPRSTYVDVGVTTGRDTVIHPGCILEGETRIGEGAEIGPYTRLVDAEVEDGATVTQSVVLEASIGPDATVGPFSYLRPGTRLERGSKAGAFVEIKKSTVGEGSKVPHLTYMGDTTVGRDANVGAGTVTVNYDGYDKHETHIGDEAFIGSGSMLMAPVRIGDRAFVAGGSAVTDDVPDDALAIGRARQVNKDGWAREFREEHEEREER